MSNTVAIAAVTGALRTLLSKVTDPRFAGEPEYPGAIVTSKPFDEINADGATNQLNVFLYQITPNATWRGRDPSRIPQRLEEQRPPLALNLHYLLTAYAKDNDDLVAHGLLGRGMSLLNDFAIVAPATITAAIATYTSQLQGSDLATQVERVRVSMQVLTIDEMSKLWTMFQAKFRVSAVYTVSVVLIDSPLPGSTPLPVLTVGRQVLAQVGPVVPVLTSLTMPGKQPSARLGVPKDLLPGPPPNDLPGDTLVANGLNLDLGTPSLVFFSQSAGSVMASLTLASATATALSVQLPTDQTNWPAGIYQVVARLAIPVPMGQPRVVDSNMLTFTLAPRILSVAYTAPTAGPPATPATFTVTCSPQVWPTQRVRLLFLDQDIEAAQITAKTGTLSFPMPAGPPPSGTYFVRLRVDDVESLLVSDYSASPPVFDTAQQVTVP
jgi:hypothetical protein